VPKRYQLSQAVIDHIFRGDSNEGTLAGFHSEARVITNANTLASSATLVLAGDNAARRTGKTQTYVASATTTVNGARLGPKKSSFFPTGWSEEQTILWLEQGLTSMNPQHAKMSANVRNYERPLRQAHTAGVGAHFSKFKANKITCYILYQGGEIATIFPFAPGYEEE
jgi:hypothetical protein